MKQHKKFKGIIVPAVTPLTKSLDIDEEAVAKMFHHFYEHDVSPFVLGTTGESASVSFPQKQHYVGYAAKYKRPGTVL